MQRQGESIDDMLARMRKEYDETHRINCPYCRAVFRDDENDHVSYWGEDPPREAFCEDCEKYFFVEEVVDRTWKTTKKDSDAEKDSV